MRVLLAIVLGLWLGDPAVAKPKSLLDSLVPQPANVKFVQGYAPGQDVSTVLGNAQTDAASGTVYYQGTLDPFARAHEVGHILDAQVLTDGDRRFFQRLMHAPAGDWRTGTGLKGAASPSEWWADYYGSAALGVDPVHENQAAYANVGPKRLKRFEQALDRLGRRHGLLPYQP